MPQFTLKELLGEDDRDNYQWTVRELEQLSTETLKDLVDEDVVAQYIKDNNPDEWDLRGFLIEWIVC